MNILIGLIAKGLILKLFNWVKVFVVFAQKLTNYHSRCVNGVIDI